MTCLLKEKRNDIHSLFKFLKLFPSKMASLVIIIGSALLCSALGATHPFATREMVAKINSLQGSWRASLRTPTAQMSAEQFRSLLGARRDSSLGALPTKRFSAAQLAAAPESYDPREHYGCKSMRQIRDQSQCGSCWAFGAVSSMSDRECMAHGKDIILSAEDVNSCSGGGDCGGGFPFSAYLYWQSEGIITEKCRPYSLPTCDHYAANSSNPCPAEDYPTPACNRSCVGGSGLTWKEDKHRAAAVYMVSGESEMMAELSAGGPCEATMDVYEDFLLYESGVYRHVTGEARGSHAIKIMGYGVDGNNTKYWLCANSWNENWGEGGYFRILRGTDECAIEGTIICGTPE